VSQQRAPGVYHLVLHLAKPTLLRVGKLGRFTFPAGYYVYTGSAMSGLERRLARHRRRKKKLRWHIDYLLGRADLVEVIALATRQRCECERNRQIMSLPGAEIVAPAFGSSDCRCATHLVYFGALRPNVSRLGTH